MGELVLQGWVYFIDHLPSIIAAIFAGLMMLRAASKKDIADVKTTVGKVAATARKDIESQNAVIESKHAELVEIGSVNASHIEEIKTATNGMKDELLKATAKDSFSQGEKQGRADQKAEDK